VVAIEPQTGYIKALVGGSDYARTAFNRAVQARRQPGSAFKSFVYLAALETGRSPADLVDDSPVSYASGGRTWTPDNYDGKFRGPITLQQALEESVNVATVRLAEQIGVTRIMEVARRLGLRGPLQANLTLALGSSDVTLLELTAAYAALANQGLWAAPAPIRYVTDPRGRLIEENIPEGREAVKPAVVYVLTHMLRGVVARGTATAARAWDRPIAGTTGTTNDFSNAWFVGYTPSLVAGVWVGRDRGGSLGRDETSARAALPIWIAPVRDILKDRPAEDFPVPEGVAMARIDMTTGFLANHTCPKPVVMAFLIGTEPTRFCPNHP
jgi:penicillin-binding protein 1A